MRCKHTEGFDWNHAVLDRRNGGWRVQCLACGETVVRRRLKSAREIEVATAIYGPKEHMSKKARLKLRRQEAGNA